ncbi:MAG: M67 family metallopeptidase [Anaerolineae bacterium]|nr:M67 family metallopeptidase [Anaerolineae bacterium]
MSQHVAEQAPLEACGLLAGKRHKVEKVIKMRNTEKSPVRFRMDPKEQFNAFRWIEANNLELAGIYHSHPSGLESVSATDIAEATYDVVHIIWSPSGDTWNQRGYRIENRQVAKVTLQIIKSQ